MKIPKAKQKEWTALVSSYQTARDAADDAVRVLNEAITAMARFRDDRVSEIDEFMDGKSDAWHDGDRASAVEDLKTEWESLGLDEVELDSNPDAAELVDVPMEPSY